jgi:hypothetical protein
MYPRFVHFLVAPSIFSTAYVKKESLKSDVNNFTIIDYVWPKIIDYAHDTCW